MYYVCLKTNDRWNYVYISDAIPDFCAIYAACPYVHAIGITPTAF